MASSYPSALDAYATLIDNTDDVLAAHANDRGDAIEAIEVKLGIDSSSVATSIDYFLKHASGAYRTHQHDSSSDDGATLDWDTCWSDSVHDHSSVAEGGSINDFKTGDWISSTVTTARTGWTNVSATYSNSFMRINATPLGTGGADTHTHTVGSYTADSHVLAISEIPAHQHTYELQDTASSSVPTRSKAVNNDGVDIVGYTDNAGGGGGHTHTVSGTSGSTSNVPVFVQVCIFQKN